MGRDRARKTIEELVDRIVRLKVRNGELAPGGGGSPASPDNYYNAPFTIQAATSGTNMTIFSFVQSMGLIYSSVYNPYDNNHSLKIDSYSADEASNGLAPPITDFSTAPRHATTARTLTQYELAYDIKSSYAVWNQPGYCAKLDLRQSKNGFIIARHENTTNFYRSLSLTISYPTTTSIDLSSIVIPTHQYAYHGNTAIAIKPPTFIYVNSSSSSSTIFGATDVYVIDNPPPLYFIQMPMLSYYTPSRTVSSKTLNFRQSLSQVFIGFFVNSDAEEQSLLDSLNNFSGRYLYVYCLSMTDDNIKSWVNASNPNSVTVHHVSSL